MVNQTQPSIQEMINSAQQAETDEENESAITWYEKIIKADPLNEYAYDRLMILFRKIKDVKKELFIINQAVKAFEQFYRSRLNMSKKISDISNKLSKSVGLIDRTGVSLYNPEPIATWKKRKATLEKKKNK
jgi:hypothetical protein